MFLKFIKNVKGTWTIADQVLVSSAGFMLGIILARTLGLTGYGGYVIAQTYILYANIFLSALVVSPMMLAVPSQRDEQTRADLITGFFGYMLIVVSLAVLGVQAAAALLGHFIPALSVDGLALPLACAIASFQVSDWTRRVFYALQSTRSIVALDALAYGGQITGVGVLAWLGELTAAGALWCMAASFGVAALGALLMNRMLRFDSVATRSVISCNWRASKDYLMSWQLQWAASSGVLLIGAGYVGPQAAGAIRAAQNLLGPINVLFQWLENVVPVRAATKFRDGGMPALVGFLKTWGWHGGVGLGALTLVLVGIREPLMVGIYGEAYKPFAVLVIFQAIYYIFGYAYRFQAYFIRVLGKTSILAWGSVWWALSGISCAALTVSLWHEQGIMLALIFGEVVAWAYLMWKRKKLQFEV